MKVVICGCGNVGSSIAAYLFAEGHQIVVIDTDAEKLRKLEATLDIQTVQGVYSSPEVLESAGATDADLIIAVTPFDEVNMIICLQAERLFNIPLKIARVRSGYYSNQGYLPLFDDLHIDVVISPEKEIARTILRNLKTPGALEFISLQDSIVFVGAKCLPEAMLERKKISSLNKKIDEFHAQFVGVVRDNQSITLDDKLTIKEDDEVYFVSDIKHYEDILEALGHPKNNSNHVIIVGGGRVGLSLAKMMELENMASHLTVVEKNENKSIYLAKHLSKSMVIHGDAMDEDILDEVNLKKADAVVCLTGEDEDNILLSLLAKQYGVKRTFSLINKNIYNDMLCHLGVDVLVNPNTISTSTILQHIRKGQVQSMYSLKQQLGDLMSFEVLETSKIVGMTLKKLKRIKNIKVCAIVRNSELMKLTDTLEIQCGDSVIILAPSGQFKAVEKLFSVGLFFF